MTTYALFDERGEKARRAGTLEADANAPLADVLREANVADYVTVYRMSPRGGYALMRKGAP